MEHIKRLAALFVTGTLLVTCAEVPLKASALSFEEYVQNAIAIANDDSHGYSNTNRWGPDYDCSSFVITALKQAGFNTGDASYTLNMKNALTRYGFKWYPWETIGDVSNLRRGDILLDEKNHTEFYIGRYQNVGAHYDCGDPETGDKSGGEISVTGYYSSTWDGILRYTNDIPKVKPSDLEITAYGEHFAAGETICFDVFSINAQEQYLELWKDGKKVRNENVTDKYEHRLSLSDPGEYTYRLVAKNVCGKSVSQNQTLTVYNEKPSGLKINAGKKLLAAGESVLFTFDSKNAAEQAIAINDGWWNDYYDVTDQTTYSISFDSAGDYTYFLTAGNPVGVTSTSCGEIVVYDDKPDDLYVSVNDNICPAGGCAEFSVQSRYAVERSLVVKKNGKEIYNIDAAARDTYSLRFDEPGVYSYRVTAKNKFGETSTDYKTLTVYDSEPDGLTLTTDNTAYTTGESVSFKYDCKNADKLTLVYSVDGGYERTFDVSSDAYGYFEESFDYPGVYVCRLAASNEFGETTTLPVEFTVYGSRPDTPTLAADKDSYITGTSAILDIEANDAQSLELSVYTDEYLTDSINVTGLSVYRLPLRFTGEYSVLLTAENPMGTSYSERVYFTSTETDSGLSFTLSGWEWNGGSAEALFTPNTETPDSPETADEAETTDEASKSVTVNADVTEQTSEPSCTESGEVIYTASVFFDGAEYTDRRTETLPAKGHDLRLTGWRWKDGGAVAIFTCAHNASHREEVEANVTRTVIESDLTVTYKAIAGLDGVQYESVRTKAAGLIGDIDRDGEITSADALAILRISAELEDCGSTKETLSDTDDDGYVTSADALDVLRRSAGLPSSETIGTLAEI